MRRRPSGVAVRRLLRGVPVAIRWMSRHPSGLAVFFVASPAWVTQEWACHRPAVRFCRLRPFRPLTSMCLWKGGLRLR